MRFRTVSIMLKKFFKERKLNLLCSFSAIILVILVWIIAYYAVKNDYIVPSFSESAESLFKCFAEKSFWAAFGMTLLRTLESFLLSFLIAGVCAVLSLLSRVFRLVLKPLVAIVRTFPTLAVILILLIWTNPKIAPVIVAVLVLFPMIYTQMLSSFETIDSGLIEMLNVYKVSKRERIFKVYLPITSAGVFAQTGANVSLGLKIIVSAEVMCNTLGSLGGLMQTSRAFLEMPRLAALTVVSVAAGLILEAGFSMLKRLNERWADEIKV